MSTTCPKGHQSSDPDYCSECGIRMSGVPLPQAPAAVSVASSGVGGGEICPDCGTPRVGASRFCEVCRYDFASLSAAAAIRSAGADVGVGTEAPPPVATVMVPPAPVSISPPTASFSTLPEKLNVVVITDPGLMKEPLSSRAAPVGEPDRVFPLDLAENLVGRRSEARGIFPEVEVSDPGVSHRHLKFIKQDNGAFAVLELGSANGTQLNGSPLTPGVAVPIKPGDELLIGMWTRLTLRSRTS